MDDYLNTLSRADLVRGATRESRLAFWINAYNALTVQGILREYPTASIQNHAARLVGYNIWRDLLLRVGDQSYSLGRMEHDVSRKLHEPRIHFAIVCASRGCPRLLNEAYTAENLEAQLQANTRHFFADPLKFDYDGQRRELSVSPIVKWYAEDFGSGDAEILKTIAQYLPDEAARQAASTGHARLSYLDYDWSLNDHADSLLDAPLPPVLE
ncbi:MAG: DUF547 domain-containing protein [Planctomycetes bacterium]|nr:DUF547 domain-containing protein [Planctomycetota bacterium]